MSIFKNKNEGIKIKKNTFIVKNKNANTKLNEGKISIGLTYEEINNSIFNLDEDFYKNIDDFKYMILTIENINWIIMNDDYLLKVKKLQNRNISILIKNNIFFENNIEIHKKELSKIIWKKVNKLDNIYNLASVEILILNTIVSNRDLVKIIKYLENKVIYKNMIFNFEMIDFKIKNVINNSENNEIFGIVNKDTNISFISDSTQINLYFEISNNIFSLYDNTNLKFEKMIEFVEYYIKKCEKLTQHEINIIFFTRLYFNEYSNLNEIFQILINNKHNNCIHTHKNFSLNFYGRIFEDFYYKISLNKTFSLNKKLELFNNGFKLFMKKIGFPLNDILENYNTNEFTSKDCLLKCFLTSSENCNILEAINLFTDYNEIEINKSLQKLNNIKNLIITPNSGFFVVENYFLNLILNRITYIDIEFEFISFGEKLPFKKLVFQYAIHEKLKFNNKEKENKKNRKYSLEDNESSDYESKNDQYIPLLFFKNKEFFDTKKVPFIYNCLINNFKFMKKIKFLKLFQEFQKTLNYGLNLEFYFSKIQSYLGIHHLYNNKKLIENPEDKNISYKNLYMEINKKCKHSVHYEWKNIYSFNKNKINNFLKCYTVDNKIFKFYNYRDIDKSNKDYLCNEIFKHHDNLSGLSLSFDFISEENNKLKNNSFKNSFSILNFKNKSILRNNNKKKKIKNLSDKVKPSYYKNNIINYLKNRLPKKFISKNNTNKDFIDDIIYFRLKSPIIYDIEEFKDLKISNIYLLSINDYNDKENFFEKMINYRLSLGFQIIIKNSKDKKVVSMTNGLDFHTLTENEKGVINVAIKSTFRNVKINNYDILIKTMNIHPFLYSFQYFNIFNNKFESRESIFYHNEHFTWNKIEKNISEQSFKSLKFINAINKQKTNEFFNLNYYIYDEELLKDSKKVKESRVNFDNFIKSLNEFWIEVNSINKFDINFDEQNKEGKYNKDREIIIIKNKSDLMILKIKYSNNYIIGNTMNLKFSFLFFNNLEFKIIRNKFFNLAYDNNLKIDQLFFYNFRKIKNIENKINIKFIKNLLPEENINLMNFLKNNLKFLFYKNSKRKNLLVHISGSILIILDLKKLKFIGNEKIFKHEGIEGIKLIYNDIISYLNKEGLFKLFN